MERPLRGPRVDGWPEARSTNNANDERRWQNEINGQDGKDSRTNSDGQHTESPLRGRVDGRPETEEESEQTDQTDDERKEGTRVDNIDNNRVLELIGSWGKKSYKDKT